MKISRQLHLTDTSNKCLEICQQRFNSIDPVKYHLIDGASLSFLKEDFINYIWSFDVFVHIVPDVEKYLNEFNRVLKPGGIAIIHHSGKGELSGSWRSNRT